MTITKMLTELRFYEMLTAQHPGGSILINRNSTDTYLSRYFFSDGVDGRVGVVFLEEPKSAEHVAAFAQDKGFDFWQFSVEPINDVAEKPIDDLQATLTDRHCRISVKP